LVGWHLHVVSSVAVARKLALAIDKDQRAQGYALEINIATDVNPIRFFSMAKS
jgi:hypothetical protein